jgi:outer membrane lipoprotein LolB
LFALRVIFPVLSGLLLTSCANLGPAPSSLPDNYQQQVGQLEQWALRGRLNIRTPDSSDTVNINWQQHNQDYDISLSGTLGLGAVQVSGDNTQVIIEKAGEEPVLAQSLEAISVELLGYAFPASELLFWIRGLPSPQRRAEQSFTPEGLLATLSQADSSGQRWELQYDRFSETGGVILPGRLRLERPPYRLTFVISDWQVREQSQ